MAAPKGFHKRSKKAKQNLEIQDIIGANADRIIPVVVFHAAMIGAYLAFGTNRARSAVKVYCKFEDEIWTEWGNSAEELEEKLCELNEILVETGKERGLIKTAQEV